MRNFAKKQTIFVPNIRLWIGIIVCIGLVLDALIAAGRTKKAGQAVIDMLNKIIAREHMGWCEALINRDVQGMQQTASWINCCLEITEKLNLNVARPLGWHENDEHECKGNV